MKAMVLSMAKVMAMKQHMPSLHQDEEAHEDPLVAVGDHFESPDGPGAVPQEPSEGKDKPVEASAAKAQDTPPADDDKGKLEKTGDTPSVDPRSAAESDLAVKYDAEEMKPDKDEEMKDEESLDELGNPRFPHLRKAQH